MDDPVTTDSSQDDGALRLTGPLRGPVWALANATLPNGMVVVAAGGSNGRLAWWNGVTGELLGDSKTADPVVVRSMTTVTLPDGQIRFATAGSQGIVQHSPGAPTSPGPTSRRESPPVSDEESARINEAHQEATAAATRVRSDHLLHTYAGLMPANPRMIKRIANALGMLLAIRSHVRHMEDDDAMARAAILLVRFPLLAARLRLDDVVDGADPCWSLPEVCDVLDGRSLESLARCLGRANPPGFD